MEIDDRGKLSSNRNLAVTSLGNNSKGISYDIGTSYAAPSVANILARLQKEFPKASSNLLKALLIHFAYWPDGNLSLSADDQLKKVLYGKGVPEFEKCAYSQTYSPAFIIEDSVLLNEVAFIPITIPNIMSKINYEKRLRATLVYNPPVDIGVKGYTLVDLDFDLFKPIKNKENKKIKLQRQTKWDHYYRQKWDNVKTDIFRWQREGWGLDWSIMIKPSVRFKRQLTEQNETQHYALVVTIEDPNKKANIYDSIKNSIEKQQRVIVETLDTFVKAHPIIT